MSTDGFEESEAKVANRKSVPILEGLPERLSIAIGTRSLRSVAREAGVSEGALRTMLRGKMPNLETATRIAGALNVRLAWLAVGEEPMRPGPSLPDVASVSYVVEVKTSGASRLEQPVDVLARIISTVDKLVEELGIPASAETKAQLVAGIYQNAQAYGSIEPVVEKLRLTLGSLNKKSA